MPLPVNSYSRYIKSLVFRPPPGLPKKDDDNPNLCTYVELRTPIGRRKVAEKLIMRTLPTHTRFMRTTNSEGTYGEILITRDAREWALVK